MQSDGNKFRDLRILIDTCSLMEVCDQLGEYAIPFFKINFGKLVEKSNAKLIIPHVVIKELEINKEKLKQAHSRKLANSASLLVKKLVEENIAQIRGQDNDTFPDNLFQQIIIQYCEKYRFCLLTQDQKLAIDVLNINNRQSVTKAKEIIVIHLTNGSLERWELSQFGKLKSINKSKNNISAEDSIISFSLQIGEAVNISKNLHTSLIPIVGDTIIDNNGDEHVLISSLGGGGEGRVYLTDTGFACKVYNKSRITEGLEKKLLLMQSKQIVCKGLCWPTLIASNRNKEFVGYLMNRAHGYELQRSIFIKPIFLNRFPNWTRIELTTLILSILEVIKLLHSKNVILGDINPMNILIENERTVFLVDTDSYQVERFACPVGTASFLAPELVGLDLRGVLRSFQNESFAISTLIFMMLMPGKPPYSHTGGGDPALNVQERHFPYSLGEKRGKNVPAGPWRYIWSNLPYFLKEAFHFVFSDGNRPDVSDWISILERYRNDLKADFISSAIFPLGFKKLTRSQAEEAGGIWKLCTKCGNGYGDLKPASANIIPVCPDCRFKPEAVACANCGTTFLCHSDDHFGSKVALCNSCKTKPTKYRCIACNTEFEVTAGELIFFREKSLSPPRRCKECRKNRVHY